jgi:hypothetical protein
VAIENIYEGASACFEKFHISTDIVKTLISRNQIF